MGVPQIWQFIDGEEDRQVAELVIAQQLFGRPYIAPPETPANAVALLRAGFEVTMADAAFLADAEKSKIDIAPAGGQRVQDGVNRIYAATPRIVERARDAIRQ